MEAHGYCRGRIGIFTAEIGPGLNSVNQTINIWRGSGAWGRGEERGTTACPRSGGARFPMRRDRQPRDVTFTSIICQQNARQRRQLPEFRANARLPACQKIIAIAK